MYLCQQVTSIEPNMTFKLGGSEGVPNLTQIMPQQSSQNRGAPAVHDSSKG